jgi:tRNA A-37 threonylcarbamoyl transferase component Bud32
MPESATRGIARPPAVLIMIRRIGDVLEEQSAQRLVGRQEEMAQLLRCLDDDGPAVIQVHGIGGCGKSALLSAFCAQARGAGAAVVSLDCRGMEPTERGFVHELGQAIGSQESRTADAAEALGRLGDRVVLALDTYERFRLLDTWLRQLFIPTLPENVRVILSGREPPVTSWFATPGWHDLFESIALGPLEEKDALSYLSGAGIGGDTAERVNRFARGHPLALTLAAVAARERPDLQLEEAALQRTVEQLTHLYLEDVTDPVLRKALQAVSTIRRTTVPLLKALVPEADPDVLYDQLQTLPFVDSERDGLHLHDVVHEAIAEALRAGDPVAYREYRRAAWRELREEVRSAGARELWRFTADLLFLIKNPVVREAFFPSTAHVLVVEPAVDDQADAIASIARMHDGPEAAAALLAWWQSTPESFAVARNTDGDVEGFYCMFQPEAVGDEERSRDPIARAWCEHLEANPVPEGQRVLFIRRWLGVEDGERPSGVQAACWLDIKRSYMELRPRLRRVYLTVRDLEPYGAVAQELGFLPLADAAVVMDGDTYQAAALDFGSGSVDGWVSRLIATELGIPDEEPVTAVPQVAPEAVPEQLAHYRLLGRIGAGGMGEVHLAEDSKLGRRVAIKVLAPKLASQPELLDRFEREAKALAALNHPNIVTIYSVEEAAGIRFLTMELVEGENLAEVIPARGFTPARLLDLAVPLADSLAAAHDRGVIHRDLKPSNVMVSDDGRVKVLDFGLAKLRQDTPLSGDERELSTEQLTAEGRILGTVAYMSPEQVQGKHVDTRSDIFSMGVTLYEMATGDQPFRGESPVEVMSAILRDTPPRVTEIRDDLPSDLARVLRRCLEKDPDRRFQTALDLRNELEDLRNEGVEGDE